MASIGHHISTIHTKKTATGDARRLPHHVNRKNEDATADGGQGQVARRSPTAGRERTAALSGLHSLLLVLLCLPAVVVVVQAQEMPSFATTPLFDEAALNASAHRQDVCSRHAQYYTGGRDLRLALEGGELHPLVRVGEFFRLDSSGAIDKKDPGMVAVLLDELANRGRFTWRNSFATHNGPGDNHTWTELLMWGTTVYDIHADWWAEIPERLRLGISFPEGFYDASLVLVGIKPDLQADTSLDLWSLVEPFDSAAWWSIWGTIILSGVIYYLLEYMDHRGTIHARGDDDLHTHHSRTSIREVGQGIWQYMFHSFLLFTQHFQFQPRSFATRVYTGSLSFWALIVVATYTANLASFFVVKNTRAAQINSIDEAIQAQLPLCMWEGTYSDTYLRKTYPKGIYVAKKEEADIFQGVTDGECAFAVSALATWERLQLDSSVHGDCNMEWIGRVIGFQQAGLAMKTDAGIKCTSLIQDVLHLHLVEMKADGFLEKAWNDEIRRTQDINCVALENAAAKDEEFVTLTMKELAGPFLFHAGFTTLAFIVAFALMCRRRHVSMKQKSPKGHPVTTNHVVPHRVMAKHVTIYNSCLEKGFDTPISPYRHSGKTMDETDILVDDGDDMPHVRISNSGSERGPENPVASYPYSGVESVNGAIDQMCANSQLNDIASQMSTIMTMIQEQKSMIEGQRVILERQNDDIKHLKQSKHTSTLSNHADCVDC